MSHFMDIIDTKRKEFFGFGKSVQATYVVFPLLQIATSHPPERFEIFSEQFRYDDGEDWEVDPVGSRRLYDWMLNRPPEDFLLYCDAYDWPGIEGPSQYWACVGSLFRPEVLDMWDRVGYLHLGPEWTDHAREYRAGGLDKSQRDDWIRYLTVRGINLPGLTSGLSGPHPGLGAAHGSNVASPP
jgi:hypothetical protein